MDTTPVGHLSTEALEQRCARILLPASSPKTRFRNWGGTFHAQPSSVYQPRAAQHVLEVVELARRKRVQLRAVGRAHSPSDLPFTKDWALRIEELKGALEIDTDQLTATFLAGTYISDIHDRLAAQSTPLALANVGSISEQTLGGLISTASHGTGINLPVVSASVREITLVLPLSSGTAVANASSSGTNIACGGGAGGGAQLVKCSRELRPELFNATLCGLGATGIIVSVKIAVVPAFRLRQAWEEVPFDSIFGTEASTSLHKQALQYLDRHGLPEKEKYVGSASEGTLSIGRLIALDKALPPSPFRFAPSSRSKPTKNIRQLWPLDGVDGKEELSDARRKAVTSYGSGAPDVAPLLDNDPELDPETVRAQKTLEGVVTSAKHTRIMWFPQSHMCTVLRAEPTEQLPTPAPLTQRLHHKIVGYHLTQLLLYLSRFKSTLPIPVARLVFRLTHPAIPDEVKAGMLLRVPVEEHEHHVAQQSGGETQAPAVPQRPAFLDNAMSNLQHQGFNATPSAAAAADSSTTDQRPTQLTLVQGGNDALPPMNNKHAHGHVIDDSWRILNMDCLFPQYTDEWALPYAFAAPCIRAMREWLAEEESQPTGARIHFPIEIRFTDADGIFLSPATGRRTCYIGIIQFRPYNLPVRYRVLFARYERLLRYFGGRPHWAKTHSCGREEVRAMYPHLEEWLGVREQVDPERVLANPYVRRHLLGEVAVIFNFSAPSPKLFYSSFAFNSSTTTMDLQHTLAAMTPDQFEQYQEVRWQLLVLYITTVSATVIILWEHFMLWGAEMRTWRALLQGKIMPARLAVVLVRYLVIAAIGITLVFLFGSPPNCKDAIVTIYALYTALVAVASSIFLMRLQIIFASQPYIMAGYYFIFVINVVAWIVVDLGFEAYEIPMNLRWKHGGKCAPHVTPRYGSIAWGCNLLFDALTLAGTWWKLHSLQKKKDTKRSIGNRTHRYIWLSNIFYFSVSCAFNIGCLVTELLVTSPIYSHLPSPIAFCAHTIISSRLLLTAKGWGTLDPEDDVEIAAGPNMNTFQLSKRRGGGAGGGAGRPNKGMPQVSFTVDEIVTIHDIPATEMVSSNANNGRSDTLFPSRLAPSIESFSKFDGTTNGTPSDSQHSRGYVEAEPARFQHTDREVTSSPMQSSAWMNGPSVPPPQSSIRRSDSDRRPKVKVLDDSVPLESSLIMTTYPRLSGFLASAAHNYAMSGSGGGGSGGGMGWASIPEGTTNTMDNLRASACSAAPSSAVLSSPLSKASAYCSMPSQAYSLGAGAVQDFRLSASPTVNDSRIPTSGVSFGPLLREPVTRPRRGTTASSSSARTSTSSRRRRDSNKNEAINKINEGHEHNIEAVTSTPASLHSGATLSSTECLSVGLERTSTFGKRSLDGLASDDGLEIASERANGATKLPSSPLARQGRSRSMSMSMSNGSLTEHTSYEVTMAGTGGTSEHWEELGGRKAGTSVVGGGGGGGERRRISSVTFEIVEHGALATHGHGTRKLDDAQSIDESVYMSDVSHHHHGAPGTGREGVSAA
ncbi:unnamed protein product [Tilletia controversa]|nr:unnamed protein product [Tilletia controversa]